MLRLHRILSLGSLALAAGATTDEDTTTLVQVQHQTAKEQPPPLGKKMTLIVKASAVQREGATVDCAGCYETGFDLTCMGRSLTFNFMPNTWWARIDGKMADTRIGWRPAMGVEHTMTVTLRSSDIHTFCITDGHDDSLKWCKDFHHTGYFPETNTDRYRCRVKTTDEKYPLNRPTNRKKCYVSESEKHCFHAPTDFLIEDETEPYESEYIDHPRIDFSHCQAWGEPHYVRYPPLDTKKLNFQGLGTYWLSTSVGGAEAPDLKLQVFNCRMTKTRQASLTVGAAIKMGRQVVSINGPVAKVNGEVLARGMHILPQGVELDISPRFMIMKGPINHATGHFAEVKIMIRKSRNSPTGYIYSVYSYLPSETVSESGGLCNTPDRSNSPDFFVPADDRKNLFDDADIADLEGTCCPPGGCVKPTLEPEPSIEEVCGACEHLSLQQAEAYCDEFNDRANAVLYENCKFDICMSCDPLETMADTELEYSEEIDGEPVGLFGPLMPVGARADPHCSNVRGENFDIRARGHMEMIEIPRTGEMRGKSFDVSALIQPIGSNPCSPTVIERLDVRGSWLPTRLFLSLKPSESGLPEIPHAWAEHMSQPHALRGNMTLDVESWPSANGESKSVIVVKVNGISLVVHQRQGTHSNTPYLDLEVRGLADFEREAGGLLGLDSHKLVEKPVRGCHVHEPMVRLAEGELPQDGRLLSLATVS